MAHPSGFQIQQVLELLAVVSSYPDEDSAVHGAVERAAQALEAEVAAVVFGERVAACVGFPAESAPVADLVAVARREREGLVVPGVGECHTVSAGWDGGHPGHLVLARGDDPFSVEERNLVRGMARLLELTLTMLRTLQAEHTMRERSDRQAAENARLVADLRQRQRLLEDLFDIQRAISHRRPLGQVLSMICRAAQDLLGDDIVTLWRTEGDGTDRVSLVAGVGLYPEVSRRRPTVALEDAGAVGESVRADRVVVWSASRGPGATLSWLTGGRLRASMAAPVHDGGTVTGGLLVGSFGPDRCYAEADVQTLRAFAEHASLALTDANTVDRMYQAFHDSLTGLASRGLFLERLTQQLGTAEREDRRVALLFLDLDRFKTINDTLGHAAGDELLVATAHRLAGQLRSTDVAARFGGDEFAIMLYGVSSLVDASVVAERIIRALGEPMIISGRQLRINASIGIALSTPGMPDPAELMRRADIAMYQAKRNGRGGYQPFVEDMLLTIPESG
jgi:diguanylate cyclase (GGDEF)-like protein